VNGDNEEIDPLQLVTEDDKAEALRIKASANRAFAGKTYLTLSTNFIYQFVTSSART
jgi:hypothetical protein